MNEIAKLGLTEQQYEKCLEDIFDKVNHVNDMDWDDIVRNYNLPIAKDTLRKASSQSIFGSVFVHEYLKNRELNPSSTHITTKQTVSINPDKSETSDSQFYIEDESRLRDYDYLLRLHNYDPRLFELVSAKNSKWNANSKQGTKTLYSSKITVKPKPPEVVFADIASWFDKLDRKYKKPKLELSNAHYAVGDKMLVLPISDLHYALRSSVLETGEEYNCEIAEKLFFDVIEDIVSRTQQYSFEKIVFTIGGDQANSDGLTFTTTKGTPQESAVGYFDMMEKLYAMTIMAIDILAEVAPVEVVLIPSNHDMTVGNSLAHYCDAWFRSDNRVTVDTSPFTRKYMKYGSTLFCFAHDGDMKKLPRLVADEARQYWSDVNMTEVFLQHLHHETVLEEYNMRISRLPTISARSSWAVGKGYNARRQCKSYIFDKNYGLTDVLYTVVK